MSAALILLDYQNGFCRTDGVVGGPAGLGAEVERRGVLDAAARCLEAARGAELTVVHVHVAFDEHATLKTNRFEAFGGMAPDLLAGSEQATICEEVAPLATEPVVVKAWVDPFVGSPLNGILRGRGVTRLFLGGVTTNHVVESSARHAADLGYEVFVVEEMCASFNMEMHNFSLELLPTVFAEPIRIDRYLELVAAG